MSSVTTVIPSAPPASRTIVYVDGYNLYHGLREKYARKYLWLDLTRFALSLLSDQRQQLVRVKYFTSAAPGKAASLERQQKYWKALETCQALDLILGHYRQKPSRCGTCGIAEAACSICGAKLRFRNEKRTDVNIATHLVRDVCQGVFDVAILVGGDTDLLAAVEAARSIRPRMIVAFPPGRANDEMRRAASGSFHITERQFKQSQFPERVEVAPGIFVTRPNSWT